MHSSCLFRHITVKNMHSVCMLYISSRSCKYIFTISEHHSTTLASIAHLSFALLMLIYFFFVLPSYAILSIYSFAFAGFEFRLEWFHLLDMSLYQAIVPFIWKLFCYYNLCFCELKLIYMEIGHYVCLLDLSLHPLV